MSQQKSNVHEVLERAVKVRVIYADLTEDVYPNEGDDEYAVELIAGILGIGSKGYDPFIFHPLTAVRKLWVDGDTAMIELL